ncbi:MAG: lysophospholipid acyltransferase family protein [Ignavibacteriales bacterium]|nr:lysophospholipid acyltransferase family protein [Ignavibacteriales bacterium]
MRYRIEYLFFLLIRAIVQALPLKSAQRLGAFIGWLGYKLSPARREITYDNLKNAFKEKTDTEIKLITRGAFQNFGISFVELLWIPKLSDSEIRKLINAPNINLLIDSYKEGKGLILLSGHFGNWELCAFGGAFLSNIPFSIIVQTQNNRFVDEAINEHRCARGNRVVPMGMSVREVIKTLQNKGVVAIAPDQSGDRLGGVYIEFFGRKTATHQGPAMFALRSGAPLLMGFMIRKKDFTYDLIIEKIDLSDLDGATEENIAEATRRHLAMLEKYIRQYPDLWLWMHRRWKHTELL